MSSRAKGTKTAETKNQLERKGKKETARNKCFKFADHKKIPRMPQVNLVSIKLPLHSFARISEYTVDLNMCLTQLFYRSVILFCFPSFLLLLTMPVIPASSFPFLSMSTPCVNFGRSGSRVSWHPSQKGGKEEKEKPNKNNANNIKARGGRGKRRRRKKKKEKACSDA